MVAAVTNRTLFTAGATMACVGLMGCGSGNSSRGSGSTSPPSATTNASEGSTATTAAATTGAAHCPTLAQANTALGVTYGNLVSTPTAGAGLVCEYTGGPEGNAGVTIFAHQSATVFAGQVGNAPGAPAMPSVPGVGDGAFGSTIGGRSIVNAYSDASRTVVAAQASGALAPVEALARVALADN